MKYDPGQKGRNDYGKGPDEGNGSGRGEGNGYISTDVAESDGKTGQEPVPGMGFFHGRHDFPSRQKEQRQEGYPVTEGKKGVYGDFVKGDFGNRVAKAVEQ